MKKIFLVLFLIVSQFVTAQTKRALEIDDMFKIKRISQTTLSPDGRYIAFILTTINYDENKGFNEIWIIDLKSGEKRNLTNTTYSENSPYWFPDSKHLAFVSMKTGTPQIFKMNVENSSELEQLTNLSTGASGPVVSPDGKKLLFISEVYPDCLSDDCNKQKRRSKRKKAKSKQKFMIN